MLEFILLGFLMHGEMSGYDLKRCMTVSMSYFFDASFGSIYPALKRSENKGLIHLRQTTENGKFKKLYQITEAGKAEFTRWLDQPIEFAKTRLDYLAKIFFLGFLPKEKAVQKLETFIPKVEQELQSLNALQPQVKEKGELFPFSTLEYGIGYYQSIINYCRDLLVKLEKY